MGRVGEVSDDLVISEHRGAEPGPVVAVLGGVHGDEEEGVLAVQLLDAALREALPARGIVRTVAIANPPAYAAGTRMSPFDGGNLARAFPGDPSGTPTERQAYRLVTQVIVGSDLLIDLHSAGSHYAMPQFVGYVDGDDEIAARSAVAAIAFGPPILWIHTPPVAPGRSLSAALELGVAAIYAEGSGGGSLEDAEVAWYVDGVARVLAHFGMLSGPAPVSAPEPLVIRGDGGDLDAGALAEHDGRFIAQVAVGSVVERDQPIGRIVDDAGVALQIVRSPDSATVMFLRRIARVRAGDVLCSLAPAAGFQNDRL